MISFKSVTKIYPGENRVLDQINLELKKGEFLFVIGGSGAGKSSLLRLLATEELPTSGSLAMFGYPIDQMAPSTLQAVRQVVGYVPQDTRLIGDLTVQENIALSIYSAANRRGSAESRSRIQELLERLGLMHLRDKPARAISGGEAQRVAMARALVRNPELIVADEPTGAQDRDYTWSMMDLLMRHNAGGATVVVATHDREIVRRVQKRSAFLKNGRLSFVERSSTPFPSAPNPNEQGERSTAPFNRNNIPCSF
jgi:cell division transport system ATP-binding protein